MTASQIVVWFTLFGLIGWLFESTYCSVVEKHWCNRGFLFGPVCPIYGVGAVGALAVFGNPQVSAALPGPLAIFFICAVGASAIEWVTSCAMEKAFGTVWWDYSDLPLNLDGRICVPAATLFGFGGLAIVYGALPLVRAAQAAVPDATFELLGLALMALLAADTTLTVCALTEVIAAVERVQGSFDSRVQGALDTGAEKGARLRDTGGEVADKIKDTGGEVAGRIRDTGEEVADKIRGTGGEVAGKIRDTGSEYADRLRDMASHMGGRHQHILHNMRRFSTLRFKGAAMRLTAVLDNIKRDKTK